MKYRIGFVTNSSSSSYTCVICGEEVSGTDVGLSDAEMYRCENDHVICESHIDFDNADKKGIVLRYLEGKVEKYKGHIANGRDCFQKDLEETENLLDEVNNGDEDTIEGIYDELEIRENLPASLCPVCRFDVLIDQDAVKYLLKKYSLELEDVRKEVQEKFTSHGEFKEYVG